VTALDAKGSPDLADTVWGLPGHVWEIGGALKLDLLDPEPAILAQQLLEGEIFTDRAAVYRAIAEHAVQRAAWVLHWRRTAWSRAHPGVAVQPGNTSCSNPRGFSFRWPHGAALASELDSPSAVVREAFQTFGERLGTLLDAPAGRSLRAGVDSLRLADASVRWVKPNRRANMRTNTPETADDQTCALVRRITRR
jgi:hypothetical protein